MNNVLVIGATGGTGTAVTQELIRSGVKTTVFGRSAQRLQSAFPKTPYVVGDAFQTDALIAAIQTSGADTIFQCAAIPYHQTVARQLPLGRAVMDAALATHTRVAFIDGIYAYGDVNGQADEATDLRTVSRKGIVKKRLSELLFSPRYQSIPKILFRLPDYYGPSARQASYLGGTLMSIAQHQLAFYIGAKTKRREYVYLPDAAKMMVTIAAAATSFDQVWNVPGQVITGQQLMKLDRCVAQSHAPVLTMTKPLIRVVGWLNPDVAEIKEMYYLTQHPIYLSHQKYRDTFGKVVATPFKVGLRATLTAYQKK